MTRYRVSIDDDLYAAAQAIAAARRCDVGRIIEDGLRMLINPIPSHQDHRELVTSIEAIAEYVGAQWRNMPGASDNPIDGEVGTYDDGIHAIQYDTRAAS